MFRSVALLFALGLALQANASVESELLAIKSVEVKLISTDVGSSYLAPRSTTNGCDQFQPAQLDPALSAGLDDIISVGSKIWKIIEDNKPVVTVDIPTVNALPRNGTCWLDYDHWQAPRALTYEVVYKNLFGISVVTFRFRLQYTYGGGMNGRGQYLANVTVKPATIDVLWLYAFNAKVEVGNTVNMGTKDDPIAGLELNLNWQVKTAVSEEDRSMQFFVQGDGQTLERQ